MSLDRSWLNRNDHTMVPRKRTLYQGDAFEDTVFKPGFTNFKILNEVVESQVFTSLWNTYHQYGILTSSSFRKVNFQVLFFFSMFTSCFTAGKRIVIWNCHATLGNRKTAIFTSVVYGSTAVLHATLFWYRSDSRTAGDLAGVLYVFHKNEA